MTSLIASLLERDIERLADRVIAPGSEHIGVDVVDIPTLTRQLDRGGDRLAQRWFTEAELAFAAGDLDRLAATLAGKEAIAKVLGTGIRGAVRWTTIEILRRPDGAPYARLHAGARDRADELALESIAISLCHEGAIAVAIASGCASKAHR
jgi:holo-[acyl-carrier protein] synthase